LLVRAAQERALAGGGRLFVCAAAWPVLGHDAVEIGPRGPGNKGRLAQVSLRAGTVRVARPRNGADRGDPRYLDLTLVEVREDQPPPVLDRIHWWLLTTLSAKDLSAVQEIAQFYRLRWRIEQTFRASKSDALRLPDLQTHEATRLFKMAALAIGAAVRTIQLVDARDGSRRPGSDVAEPAVLRAAAAIGPTLEGKTLRQQNPHPPASLPWLSWIGRSARRWELLLQTARVQDHARRLGQARRHGGHWIAHCKRHNSLKATYYFRESRSRKRGERAPATVIDHCHSTILSDDVDGTAVQVGLPARSTTTAGGFRTLDPMVEESSLGGAHRELPSPSSRAASG
jgi:hypothetical protein